MRSRVLAVILIPAVVVVVVDRVLKAWILREYAPPDGRLQADLLGTIIRIEYVENTGVAFGMLGGGNRVMAWLMPVVLLLLGLLVREQILGSRVAGLGAGLVLGGAIGNFIDRLQHGFVVDFIAVGPWPRFNVADAAITCGVGLVLWSLLVPARREQPAIGVEP